MAKTLSLPIIKYPGSEGQKYLAKIAQMRQRRNSNVDETVIKILNEIRSRGDHALLEFIRTFDGVDMNRRTLRVSEEMVECQALKAAPELKRAIREAAKRIEAYHRLQYVPSFTLNTSEGQLKQIVRPLKRVAVYIPGGHAVYPSTVLMNVIPAKIAGVPQIVAVTPPRGELDPGIAYALKLLGVKEIYRMGGAQAIGALAYGTASVHSVDKIVGPGSSYVQAAKRLVFGTVDIDSIAGPSEVVIIADEKAEPRWVALDLLAQAEHGSGDEIAICITESLEFAEAVRRAALEEIEKSAVRETLLALPPHAITIFVSPSRQDSMTLSNLIAPEHLQLMTKTYRRDLKLVENAGAVFMGAYTPVALGDYYVGTNHVLPTGGGARFASPLGVDSFLKRISVAEVTKEGLADSAQNVSVYARFEGFIHHALSVERRLKT